MPKINVLPKSVAELIAAGEVVERPASVIKELVENSIDAGATHITVEIQRGGVVFMRISDDGCGISRADVPLAFLRHATSKIKTADDLDAIATLGFRGEALAATSSVARVELLTKTPDEPFGTHYKIEGGIETLNEESGCPDGTTIIVRDLFYNTPARMKFLKKDVSEGNTVAAVLDRAALSHPEISFKLLREGKQTLMSPGDGKAESAIYSVLGRDFSKSLIPVDSTTQGISVTGFTCKPVYCRQSRAAQYVFLNGRFVHSGTVAAAVEQAYKNSAMVGKFPGFVLNLKIPLDTVDVNVHPAKTEVRFSDEHRIFEAVHYAVKSAIVGGDTRPVIPVSSAGAKAAPFSRMTTEEYRQQSIEQSKHSVSVAEKIYEREIIPPSIPKNSRLNNDNTPLFLRDEVKAYTGATRDIDIERQPDEPMTEAESKKSVSISPNPVETAVNPSESVQNSSEQISQEPEMEIRLIGEAFRTYIVVESGNSVYLIDKHAAHERVLFEQFKLNRRVETQLLLAPVHVTLGKEEYDAILSNTKLLLQSGFEIEDFGSGTVLVRAVPATLTGEDIPSVLCEAAASLCERGSVQLDRLETLYHTVACKAAIKAGYITGDAELLSLAKRVLQSRDIMYCPHGRPVAFEIKRHDLEKQFGRIQ